jgi:GST-like protein
MPQPLNLYYWPTPNGKKVALFLEEAGLPYVLVPIDITAGDQHTVSKLQKPHPSRC